jgi:hypothetical protein
MLKVVEMSNSNDCIYEEGALSVQQSIILILFQ